MRRTTLVTTLAVGSVGLAGLAVATASSMSSSRELALASSATMKVAERAGGGVRSRLTQFDPGETSAMLSRLSLSPKHLASAGLTVNEAELVVGAMMTHLAAYNSSGEFAAATRAVNEAHARAARYPTPRAGAPTPPPAPDVAALQNDLASKIDLAFAAAVQNLPGSKATKLSNMRANARWELPLHYLVVAPNSRTDAQWLALKGAVAHVGTAAQKGVQPASAPLAIFDEANDDTDVETARTDLAGKLADIKGVWMDLLGR